jgi:Coenzyme PQQ synthesis protein D (PqqD)
MDVLAARANVPEHVVHRTIAEETIVLNLETGRYHRLNPSAGRMFEVLAQSESVADAARVVAAEYERPLDEIEGDLSELCTALSERGLVELVHAG